MKNKLLMLLGCMLIIQSSNAYEVKKVCAKYKANYDWSKVYQVQAEIYDGNELNQATAGSSIFGRYSMFDHYAVIWWDKGQASIIKLNNYIFGMGLGIDGIDQNGRAWRLSEDNYGMCTFL